MCMQVEVNWDQIEVWCKKLRLEETRTQLDWDLLDRALKKLGDMELIMKQVRMMMMMMVVVMERSCRLSGSCPVDQALVVDQRGFQNQRGVCLSVPYRRPHPFASVSLSPDPMVCRVLCVVPSLGGDSGEEEDGRAP
jgi:hypothetical protein